MLKDQIIETWRIHNRVNLMLLDAISDEGLHSTLSTRGGGTPARQFTHLHNLRLLKLEKFSKQLRSGLTRIDKDEKIDKALLKKRLSESGEAMAKCIEQAVDEGGKVKGFKRGLIPMLGYMISHESHHRGNIMLTLKQCGHKIPKDISYGIWAWNQI